MPGVTKEQIQAAREADLFAWLQSHEPGVLKRDGPNYRHKEHDSLVYVTGKRYWYWNSRGRSINALDYLIQIRGYGLVDAVQALAGGEIRQTPAYRASYKANIACKEAIEQAIADHYRDNRLGTEAVHQVLEQFGYDRMFYVLAGTVRQKDWDGRISRDNKAWAKTIPVYENPDGFGQDRNVYFVVDRSHPGLVDLFLTQARLDYTKEHGKKVSIREGIKQSTERTAAVHAPTKRKEPER